MPAVAALEEMSPAIIPDVSERVNKLSRLLGKSPGAGKSWGAVRFAENRLIDLVRVVSKPTFGLLPWRFL
jgi:hypothetical protein